MDPGDKVNEMSGTDASDQVHRQAEIPMDFKEISILEGEHCGCEPGKYIPLCVVSESFDGDESDRRIAVAIHIPSRSTRQEFMVSVDSSGKCLHIGYTWPKVITDVSKLLRFKREASG